MQEAADHTAAQVAAARRLQCWLRGRLLAARVTGRRRQLEAARLGREVLARLAAAHEARLAGARDGIGEGPGELQLSSEERREDARVWAAAELRRLAGVSEAVVEVRLQRQREEYEERLRVGSRRGNLAAAGGGGGSSGGTGQLETQIRGSRGGRHSTTRQRGRGGSSGEGQQRGRLYSGVGLRQDSGN